MVIPSSGWIIAFQLYLYTFLGHIYLQYYLNSIYNIYRVAGLSCPEVALSK